MRIFPFILLFVLLMAAPKLHGQETPKALLFDELTGNYNCEDLLARLDSFVVELGNKRVKGTIIFNQSDDPIDGIFIYQRLSAYSAMRGISNLFSVVSKYNPSRPGIEFWMGHEKSLRITPTSVPTYRLVISQDSKPIYFSGELYERTKIDGKWTLLGYDCAACCVRRLYLFVLGAFLDANPGTIGYFILRGNLHRSDQVKSLLRKDALKAGLSPSRVRFLYAGFKRINSVHKLVEVEAFISLKKTTSTKDFPYQLATN